MLVVSGYHHPQLGLLGARTLDSSEVEDWPIGASLVLIEGDRFVIEGQHVLSSDLTPVITFDPALDRMFNRECGYRRESGC